MKKNQGFYGKGFKFDETEAQLAAERKKLQKAALGLQDSDEEDAGVDVSKTCHKQDSHCTTHACILQSINQTIPIIFVSCNGAEQCLRP